MRFSLVALTLPLAACAPPPAEMPPPPVQSAEAMVPEPAAQAPRIAYPATRRMDLVETQFGVAIPDPYRWLENDVRTDPEVRAWVEAQNAVTDAFLATLPARGAFKARMTEIGRASCRERV